jgi:hypothetical protein
MRALRIKEAARPVVKQVPGEFLHRGASYVIIAEGVFHTFHQIRYIVFAAIVFLLVEVFSIKGDYHQRGGAQ